MDDPSKDHLDPERTTPKNYRPITCLPMMWKILMAHITDKTADSSSRNRKRTGGTGLLYIDQYILNESKTRWKKSSYGLD